MLLIRKNGATSNVFRVTLRHSTTGAGLTGLTEASAGLIIATITDNEATTTRYRASSSEVETISTLGTFAAPTSGKCRFKEVDATNHPGLYEVQLADARFAVSSAKILKVHLSGATNLLGKEVTIQLSAVDVDDATRAGMAALPNAAAEAPGGLYTRGTGAGQINQSANGQIDVNAERLNNVAQSLLDLKDFADDGYDPSTNKIQGLVLADTVTTLTSLPSAPTDWLNSTALAASALAEIRTYLFGQDVAAQYDASGYAKISDGTGTGQVGLTGGAIDTVLSVTDLADNAINAATFAADVDAEILSYIVDDATRIDASDLNSKIDSLTFTVAGKVDANTLLHLGSTPAALTTNGYYQAMVLRWLTDNAAGTPDALIAGRVESQPDGYIDGYVYVSSAGASGTTLNVNGTLRNPTTSSAQAVTIAAALGLNRIRFLPVTGNEVFTAQLATYDSLIIDLNGITLDVDSGSGSTYVNAHFHSGVIGGTLLNDFFGGPGDLLLTGTWYENVQLNNPKFTSQLYVKNCAIYGQLWAAGGTSWEATFEDCYPVQTTTTINMGSLTGTTNILRLLGWAGDLSVTNMRSGETLEVYGYAGKITVAASCTGGTIKHTSHHEVTNNGSGMTIDLVSDATATDAIYSRIGAPAGVSIAADLLTIDNFVDDLESRIGTPSNLGSGATISANLVDIEGFADSIPTDVWAAGTRTLTALGFTLGSSDFGTDWFTSTGLAASAVAEIQSGMATAAAVSTLQTSVNTIDDYIDTEIAAIIASLSTLETRIPGVVQPQTGDAYARLATYRLGEILSAAKSGQPVAGSFLGDLTENDGGVQRFTTNALEQAPAGGGGDDPWDEPLPGAYAAGTAGYILGNLSVSSGTGARTVTVTVNDGTTALQNASVRLTEGINSYLVPTNASGVATFNLDDATYTVAITKSGYTFAGTTLVVDGNETVTYSMTQLAISPSTPGQVTGYLHCYNTAGVPVAGVEVSIKQLKPITGSGIAYDGSERTGTSNGAGLIEFTNLFLGGRYRLWRGEDDQNPVMFTIDEDQADPMELPSVIDTQ